MEDSLFSRPEMIEASKKFVRVRLNAHEDRKHALLLIRLRALTHEPKYILNNDFFLLDPTGEKVLFRKGARPYPDFMDEEGGLAGILEQMQTTARMYVGKAPQAELVPWNKSLSGALFRAHADGEPVLLLVTDDTEDSKSVERAVGDPVLLQRFRNEFYFLRVDKGSPELASFKLPAASGLLFLRPSQLGTQAVIMNTKADAKELPKSMAAALDEFSATFPKLSREQITEKGRAEKILHYPGTGKNLDPGR